MPSTKKDKITSCHTHDYTEWVDLSVVSALQTIQVTVTTLDGTLEVPIAANTTGQQLLDEVTDREGIKEKWFFGLRYQSQKGHSAWLVPHEKVLSLKKTQLQFKLSVKFFPEDVGQEVIQDATIRYIFHEVKDKILSGEIVCDNPQTLILAIYYCQAVFGDYSEDTYKPGKIVEEAVPPSIRSQLESTSEKWEEVVVREWKKLTGSGKYRLREVAMLEYIIFAQDVETYGVEHFPVQLKGEKLRFGIENRGVVVSDENGDVPFLWDEISDMTVHDKKFVMKLIDGSQWVFYTTSPEINKDILHLCIGNRELYFRRRAPMTAEVRKIKANARKDGEARAVEDREANWMKRSRGDQAESSFVEDFTENEEVNKMKEALLFYQDAARKIEEKLAELKRDKGRHKSESLARMSVVLDELIEKPKEEPQSITEETEAQHPVIATQAQTMEDKVTAEAEHAVVESRDTIPPNVESAPEVQTQDMAAVAESAALPKEEQKEQAETEKGRIEKVEDVKTAALQGETKERSDEEAQPLKESTTSEESTAAQTKRASTVKARIEGFKIAELQGKSTERSNQNAQPLKESTSSEERKAAKIKRAATVKARIEGFKTAASQGKTKEKSNEEVQPLKQSTTSEESKVAQKEQAVTVKPRIEKVEDVKTSGETKEEVQSLKESTSSEESKVAENTQQKEQAETVKAETEFKSDNAGEKAGERKEQPVKEPNKSQAAVEETDSSTNLKVEQDLPAEAVSVSAIAANFKMVSKPRDGSKAPERIRRPPAKRSALNDRIKLFETV